MLILIQRINSVTNVTAGSRWLLYHQPHDEPNSKITWLDKRMEKASSCIAVFFKYEDAHDAIQKLLKAQVDENQISLVGKELQQRQDASVALSNLDDDLYQLGVQEANLYCYKCLVHSGSYLVIISGNYEQVERVCNQLEQQGKADISIHFNSI